MPREGPEGEPGGAAGGEPAGGGGHGGHEEAGGLGMEILVDVIV